MTMSTHSSDTVTTNSNGKHWLGSEKLTSTSFCAWLTRGRLLAALGICVVLITLLFAQCTSRLLRPSSFLRGQFDEGINFCGQQHGYRNADGEDQIKRDDIKADEECDDEKPLVNVTAFNGSASSSYRVVSGNESYPCANKALANVQEDLYESDPSELPVRKLPQCLIIGVRKGGTRALLEFLNLHPGIRAERQEIHFFDIDEQYDRGLGWYRQQMRTSHSGQITIEKTPAYYVEPNVARRVREMNSSIKLLVTVRDPIKRAISDYLQINEQRVRKGKESLNFEHLVINSQTGRVNGRYQAVYRSLYDVHLLRWLRYFPLEQFHFVSAENLVDNPVEELQKVEDFLGLRHRLTKDLFYFNKTRGFYCMCIDQRRREAKPNKAAGREGKCLSSSKGRPHPDVDPDVLKKLRDFFRPHNQRFYEIVGINFGW